MEEVGSFFFLFLFFVIDMVGGGDCQHNVRLRQCNVCALEPIR